MILHLNFYHKGHLMMGYGCAPIEIFLILGILVFIGNAVFPCTANYKFQIIWHQSLMHRMQAGFLVLS